MGKVFFLKIILLKFLYGVGGKWWDGFLFLCEYGERLDGLFLFLLFFWLQGGVTMAGRAILPLFGGEGEGEGHMCHYEIGQPLVITWPYF